MGHAIPKFGVAPQDKRNPVTSTPPGFDARQKTPWGTLILVYMNSLRVVAILLSLTAAAQFGWAQSHGYGFMGGTFAGRGRMGGAFRLGIGGEMRVAPLVNLGGEVGSVHNDGTGVIGSGNASVHVPLRSDTVDPFVTGGVSAGYVPRSAGLWVNLGGGLNYWFRRNVGLRVEFRGYAGGVDLPGFAEFRVGVSFR